MKTIKTSILLLIFSLLSCKKNNEQLGEGMFALLETSKGDVVVSLEYKKTPITVANFVLLTEGKNPFVDEKFKGKPYYDGLTFHRVLNDFMIQGGDPDANGLGGPGYKFKDEFNESLTHSKPGILSMANAGPGTNGSQFFITHKETPWLDNIHTVFGEVKEGMEVVNTIAQGDVISKVTIIRNGKDATGFDALKVFKDYYAQQEVLNKEIEAQNKIIEAKKDSVIMEKKKFIAENKKTAKKSASGLQIKVLKSSNGAKPKVGTKIFIKYAGYLEDGTLFDTNYEDVALNYAVFNQSRKNQNGYEAFPFTYGDKQGLIPGFIEGFDNIKLGDKVLLYIPYQLGYGEAGNGPIPPKTDLVFEIEMLEKK